MAAPASTPRAGIERTAGDLVLLLASTLGREKSEALVFAAVAELGLDPARLTSDQTFLVLDALSRHEGLVGITARFALSRLAMAPQAAEPASAAAPRSEERAPASEVVPVTVALADLTALLASSMGNEKADELVREATKTRAVVAGRITQADALAVLEDLARAPGIVGVTARFAKARLALRSKP